MYESSETLVKQLDKIGDKLANVMKISRRKIIQETAEEGTETDPIVEVETIQEKTTETTTGMVVGITTTETEVEIVETIAETELEIEVEEETDLILEREEEINQDLGSGQRYFDRNDICSFCNRTGLLVHNCFRLENYLKRKGKKIVLHDDDDVEEIAQAVQHLNTKLKSR